LCFVVTDMAALAVPNDNRLLRTGSRQRGRLTRLVRQRRLRSARLADEVA